MRYKLLLLGKNDSIIEDIFLKMEGSYELMTTSWRLTDMTNHIKYFEPDAIVFCLFKEERTSISQVIALKNKTIGSKIPVIVIGGKEDVEEFGRIAINEAGLVLQRPITAVAIKAEITNFLDQIRIQEEQLRKEEEEEAARKAAEAEAEEDAFEDVAEEPPAVVEKKAAKAAPTKDKTILVVDDDIRMVKVIKRHLEEHYNVASAISGAVALRYLSKKHVDLVLLDFMMPEMNGPEVLKEIRSNPSTSALPVVFLTGASEREKITEALMQKPQGYLLKPVDKDQLMQTLRKLI